MLSDVPVNNKKVVISENSTREDRLISSEFAAPGEFPYFASLRINGRHFCGGSLISRNTVLTAAHCVSRYVTAGVYGLTVVVGSNSLTPQEGSSYSVLSVHAHEWYNRQESSNDIGIVKVNNYCFFFNFSICNIFLSINF